MASADGRDETDLADVAVVGDGPAGAALAAACRDAGLDVVLVGRGDRWSATYATWRDDVADLPDHVFVSVSSSVVAVGDRRHVLARPYGVLDGDRLRAFLTADVAQVVGDARSITHHAWGDRVAVAGGDDVRARVAVDATGRGLAGAAASPRAWQTAFGVVLDDVRVASGLRPGETVLMDWRALPSAPDVGVPTFAYVVRVADGWLVEETVLAASPAVAPDALAPRLAARLGPHGADLVAGARRVERVRIPMGTAVPRRGSIDVAFGAAAGYVHPATGYSVAASLRAAPRVAGAIADGIRGGATARELRRAASEAVWPSAHRRARALHDFGLAALERLDGDDTRAFFDAFFDLPVEQWREHLRVDVAPGRVARVMSSVFRSAPWPVRRRLALGDPRPLLRALRP